LRPPTHPFGFCGHHRADSAACTDRHPDGLRPCRSCEQDFDPSWFKAPTKRICRPCRNAHAAHWQRERYRTNPAFRDRRKRAARGQARPNRVQHYKPLPRKAVAILGYSDNTRWCGAKNRTHIVVRLRDFGSAVACGGVSVEAVSYSARYRLCQRCVKWSAGLQVVPVPDEAWRPSLPIVELEVSA
jgi:hypothetical protein